MRLPGHPDDNATVSLPATTPSPGPSPGESSYLLVIEGGSSSTFRLPTEGEVVIGRAQDAEVRIQDGSVSRRHALLSVSSGEGAIADLGSHNGTRVNGQSLAGATPLVSGDVISVGEVILVLHQKRADTAAPSSVLSLPGFRQRLAEDVARALRYQRPSGVLFLDGADTVLDPPVIAAALEAHLRPLDACACWSASQCVLSLNDLEPDEMEEVSRRLLDHLLPLAPRARAGLARCPADGSDADALLSLARRAASAALPGALATEAQVVEHKRLGEHVALIADPAMLRLHALLEQLAPSTLPVLIHGETGTGKELAAAALHQGSPRRGQRLLAINCAALPEALVESELFGHERGAFSGAVTAKVGLLESAQGGTVFLDEVAELSLSTQARLLRVLETRRLTRLGEVHERPVDLRLVAATHRELSAEVQAGRFRQDLYFRLNAAVVHLPPLRHRRVEIPILARAFLQAACEQLGRAPLLLSDRVMACLLAFDWPGNVRELKNDMAFLAATVRDASVEPWHLPSKLGGPRTPVPVDPPVAPVGAPPRFRPIEEELRELERARMVEALEASGGVQTHAAELLAMPRRTFFTKMKQYGLSPRPPR
ncbi:sigma 54-interacting transcriptional regulator [Corallococcus carmarthensis]|uniref:FHA domain-containing protein n=1 Tax=Corallococcus carmarthensis TaxID=2316728 RepID=A0A3A8KI76_9BACT|nr:sigma 54-interacting transcriptional regulator [Corallococcus carmarthensis]RKH07918.1 FHA domain-containing protein [Corallococcus carmarthensis]